MKYISKRYCYIYFYFTYNLIYCTYKLSSGNFCMLQYLFAYLENSNVRVRVTGRVRPSLRFGTLRVRNGKNYF